MGPPCQDSIDYPLDFSENIGQVSPPFTTAKLFVAATAHELIPGPACSWLGLVQARKSTVRPPMILLIRCSVVAIVVSCPLGQASRSVAFRRRPPTHVVPITVIPGSRGQARNSPSPSTHDPHLVTTASFAPVPDAAIPQEQPAPV